MNRDEKKALSEADICQLFITPATRWSSGAASSAISRDHHGRGFTIWFAGNKDAKVPANSLAKSACGR